MILKTTDKKGRISLGSAFANMPVRIDVRGPGEWVVQVVEPIPANEAWLMKNKEALNLVASGILDAQRQDFVEDPREGRNYSWLDEVEEDV